MPPAFAHRSLRAYLLRRFLPLIGITTALITAWAMFGNLFSVWSGGIQWVRSSTHRLRPQVGGAAQEAAMAQVLVTHLLENGMKIKLPESYSLLELGGDQSFRLLAGEPVTASDAATELLKFHRAGLYEWNGNLAYILPFSAPDRKKRRRELILVRKLNNRFTDRLAAVLGTEVEILMLRPQPSVVATSWRNSKNERIYPGFGDDEWNALARLKKDQALTGARVYEVPDYRGLYSEYMGERAYSRGARTVRSFHAFTPITDENGERIGYFAVIVPMTAMLGSMWASMGLSLLCGLVVAFLGAVLIVRTSDDVARPITALSERIGSLTRIFYSQTPQSDGASNEIENLVGGVDFLQSEMERAERIALLVTEERERAQSASKMAALGEISASVAHEINNPVAVIHALSDELKEKAATGKAESKDTERIATEIKNTASRAATIIRALLRLARNSEADRMEWCSLKAVVEDAVLLARDRMMKVQIAFSIHGLDDDIQLYCRGVQISQVLLNLMNNAIDAVEMGGEKWIRLEVVRGTNSVWLSVIDGGPGIPASVRDRFMEPFVTTKEPGKGTGLGLSLSKHIVNEHGGKMFLDEQSAHTKVVFGLPIGGAQEISRETVANSSSLSTGLGR